MPSRFFIALKKSSAFLKNNVVPPLFFNLIFNEEKNVDSVRDRDEDWSVQKSTSDLMILQEFLP